jgi:6-phosphogluconolactonase
LSAPETAVAVAFGPAGSGAGQDGRTPPVLYVAGHGTGDSDGLHRFCRLDGRWEGSLLARAAEVAAMARHPGLPVVYAVSGTAEGTVHAWDVSGDKGRLLGETGSRGTEPCHVAIDPVGRLLVVSNYASGTLALQRLGADGSFEGPAAQVALSGSSVDPLRQEHAHPHMAAFFRNGDAVLVADLGSDLLRHYALDVNANGEPALVEGPATAFPPGTGPRHLAILPHGGLVFSGELASTVLTGTASSGQWSMVPSTGRSGPARTRSARNYPGDIQASGDGRYVYCANRGQDTVATFAVDGGRLRLVSERDSGTRWPQHLLVAGDELLVAGRDSSTVVSFPLEDGFPGEPRPLFDCAGATWLLAGPAPG